MVIKPDLVTGSHSDSVIHLLNVIQNTNNEAMKEIREDIHDLKSEVKQDIQEVKKDVELTRTEVNDRIQRVDDRVWNLIVILVTTILGALLGFWII